MQGSSDSWFSLRILSLCILGRFAKAGHSQGCHLIAQGGWLWAWKDSIDQAWMHRYGRDLPFGEDGGPGRRGMGGGAAAAQPAAPDQDPVAAAAGPEALAALAGGPPALRRLRRQGASPGL